MATAPPTFPVYVQRLISSTNDWEADQFGAYFRLLMHQWDNIFIHDNPRRIMKITGLDEKAMGLYWVEIRAKFVEVEPGKLQNAFLETLRHSKEKFIEKQRENGAKGGRPKKIKAPEEPKENPSLTQIQTQSITQPISQINPLGNMEIGKGNIEEVKGGTGGKPPKTQKPPKAPAATAKTTATDKNPKAAQAWQQVAHNFSDKAQAIWEDLCVTKLWKKKEIYALTLSLKKLTAYEEAFTVSLMERAIAGGYQGVVFDNTDQKYEAWKRGQKQGSGGTSKTEAANGIIDQDKLYND